MRQDALGFASLGLRSVGVEAVRQDFQRRRRPTAFCAASAIRGSSTTVTLENESHTFSLDTRNPGNTLYVLLIWLINAQNAIPLHVVQHLVNPAWPLYLNALCFGIRPKTEVRPLVAGRTIAP